MRSRGFSLFEVLVASTLLLLTLTLAFGYLIPATRAAYRLRVRSGLQQSAVVAFRKIQVAAGTTSPAGFSWSSANPVAMAFNPSDDVQPGNAVLRWTDAYDLFWWDETGKRLLQRRWPPGAPTATAEEKSALGAKRLLPPRLAEILAGSDERDLVLAGGVIAMSVAGRGSVAGELVQPVTVSLTLVEEGRRNDPNGAPTLTQSLTFRLVNQQ